MPFPLIAAALGAAGSAISAGINQSGYDDAAAAARRAGRLGVNAYNKAGNIGANAATTAANVGSTAATTGAQQQVAGYNQALDAVRSGTGTSLNYLAPYNKYGQGGMSLLSDALGINGQEAQRAFYSNFQTDPGFEATRAAGAATVDQGAATGGLLRSGGAAKALYNFGQRQMQSQFQHRLARLLGVGQEGLQAAGKMADVNDYGTGTVADLLSKIGAANAAGTTGAADWTAGGILGSAAAKSGALLSAAKTRTNTMQNTSLADLLGQGERAGAANDLFGKFSGPLSQYAGNALSGLRAPKPGLIF